MNHIGSVIIETQKRLLRQFTENDTEAVFNNWTSDEKVTEFLSQLMHKSIDITVSEILSTIATAGFIIEGVNELIHKELAIEKLPAIAKELLKPNFLIVEARKA